MPGVKLFTESTTTMQLCISRIIVHSAFFIHLGTPLRRPVRNDTHPQQAKVPLYLCARVGVLLYNPVVPDRRLIFRSKRRAEHRHNKRQRQRRCRLLRSLYSFLYSYVSPSARQLSTTFPVHIASPVNTGTINLPEC